MYNLLRRIWLYNILAILLTTINFSSNTFAYSIKDYDFPYGLSSTLFWVNNAELLHVDQQGMLTWHLDSPADSSVADNSVKDKQTSISHNCYARFYLNESVMQQLMPHCSEQLLSNNARQIMLNDTQVLIVDHVLLNNSNLGRFVIFTYDIPSATYINVTSMQARTDTKHYTYTPILKKFTTPSGTQFVLAIIRKARVATPMPNLNITTYTSSDANIWSKQTSMVDIYNPESPSSINATYGDNVKDLLYINGQYLLTIATSEPTHTIVLISNDLNNWNTMVSRRAFGITDNKKIAVNFYQSSQDELIASYFYSETQHAKTKIQYLSSSNGYHWKPINLKLPLAIIKDHHRYACNADALYNINKQGDTYLLSTMCAKHMQALYTTADLNTDLSHTKPIATTHISYPACQNADDLATYCLIANPADQDIFLRVIQ